MTEPFGSGSPWHCAARFAVLLAVLLAGGLGAAQAQTTAETTASTTAETATTIVVTGSLREQRVLDAPFAVGSIGADTLRAAGPMLSLAESLQRIPGLQASNRHNHAQDMQLSSRGFGSRATFGVRGLRLYSDGIPATMPDGQGQPAHIDLSSAARVEVLRGPFSVLYGNASGGVVAVFSAPADRAEAEVAQDVGPQGLRQLRVQGALPWADGAAGVRLSAAAAEMPGFRPQSEATRRLVQARGFWQGGQGTEQRVVWLASHHEQDALDPLGLTRSQFEADDRQTTPQASQFNTRKTVQQSQVGVRWAWTPAKATTLQELSLAVHGGRREVWQWLAIAPATQGNPRHGGGVIAFDRGYDGVELRARLALAPSLGLQLGLSQEGLRDERRGYENFLGTAAAPVAIGQTGRLRRDETNRATSREVFAQVEWAASDAAALTGGLRQGGVRMTTADRFLANGDDSGALRFRWTQPVLGLRWRLAGDARDGLTLHTSLARGTEAPTLGELAYRPDAGSGFNAALREQRSRQIEAGLKWRRGTAAADLTLFAIRTEREIGVFSNAGGRASFQNIGRTARQGVEVATALPLAARWRLQASATVLAAHSRDAFATCTRLPCTAGDTVVAPGARLAGAARTSGWAELSWQAAAGTGARWRHEAALEGRARSATPTNDANSETAPGHGILSLRWSSRLALAAGETLTLQARVENLADRRHVGSVIVNEANGRFHEPGAPRGLGLAIRYNIDL